MDQIVVCPECQWRNAAKQTNCKKCGGPLSGVAPQNFNGSPVASGSGRAAPSTARGVNGQITVEGSVVVIERKGAMGFLTQGHKGAKRISMKDITAIQFKEPGALTNGYIQFSFMGGAETKRGVFDAAQDENSVIFNKSQRNAFRAILDHVEGLRGAPATAGGGGMADLEKLAELRDRGIVTEEEFAAKKRAILGR